MLIISCEIPKTDFCSYSNYGYEMLIAFQLYLFYICQLSSAPSRMGSCTVRVKRINVCLSEETQRVEQGKKAFVSVMIR